MSRSLCLVVGVFWNVSYLFIFQVPNPLCSSGWVMSNPDLVSWSQTFHSREVVEDEDDWGSYFSLSK